MTTFTELEVEAITSLLDVAIDAEATACVYRHLNMDEKASALGRSLRSLREEVGSYAFRDCLKSLALEVEAVWLGLGDDPADCVSFDFEFCEWALEARYIEDLHGADFATYLRNFHAAEVTRVTGICAAGAGAGGG